MPLIAIPNISEGRDLAFIEKCAETIEGRGARVLDIHSDGHHNRSVLTTTAADADLVAAMVALAKIAARIDLRYHEGIHPRLGGLDVCPFVPHECPMTDAVAAARTTGNLIAASLGIPVFLYGAAALRPETRALPVIRSGGLDRLAERIAGGFLPDLGGPDFDRSRGVVCVGARPVLIAFNVWLRCEPHVALKVARQVRESSGGLAGVRALGLVIEGPDRCQVSMNLVDPERTGIEEAFAAVERSTASLGGRITGTEIVGLVPERFMPNANDKAARLLIKPGRSLESILAS